MSIETRVRQTGNLGGGGGSALASSSGLAGTTPSYLLNSGNGTLPNSLILKAGSSVTLASDGTAVYITAITNAGGAASSAGLAGTGVFYLGTSANSTWPNWFVVTPGSSMTAFTSGSNYVLNAVTSLFAGSGGLAGTGLFYLGSSANSAFANWFVVTPGSSVSIFTSGSNFVINAITNTFAGSAGLAGTGVFYLGTSANSTWPNWFVLTAGSSITTFTSGSNFVINATTGGGASSSAGLAGTGAFYLVTSGNSTLPNAVTYASAATGFFYLAPQAAQLYPSNSAARIDAGSGIWRLLYSATTAQAGKWQWVMPQDYSGSPKLRVLFSSDSGLGATKTVIWYADAWGRNPSTASSFLYNDTWGTVNTVTLTLPNTYVAGQMTSTIISLANVVSWQAGNFVRLRLTQSGGTVVGNTELLAAMLEYTRA